MASDLIAAEALLAGAAAAAAFAGLAAAAAVRATLRRGDGGGRRRFAAAMAASSLAVAAGAWTFVGMVRRGAAPPLLLWYVAAGFAVGLLPGLFPRTAGLPAAGLAVAAVSLAAIWFGPWLPWSEGQEAVRLTAYGSAEEGALLAFRVATGPRGSVEGNLRLAPGPVTVEIDVVDVRGPLSLAFGTRRYRASAILAAGERVALGDGRGAGPASDVGLRLARLLGCTVSAKETEPFEPAPLAGVSYIVTAEGGFLAVRR